jgi:hypothetical protein
MGIILLLFGIVVSGGLVGYAESMIGRAIIDALAPTLIETLDTASAAPGADEAPGFLVLLWGVKTAVEFRAVIWWIAGIIQALALLGLVKSKF